MNLFRLILTFFIVFVWLPALIFAARKPTAQPQIIKLERFRKALWTARVVVKGKPGNFLLDTGGGVTLLTEDFLTGIECKFWGRATGFDMFGKRGDAQHCDNVQISAGDVDLTPVSVGKINFGDRFAGDKTPDGLLALDAFDGKTITLDQAAATITIETAKSRAERIKRMTELPMRAARECSARCLSVFLGVATANGMAWLGLDSGAGGVSLIAKEYAGLFGLADDNKEQRLKYRVAPGVVIESPALVTNLIMDGNLGQPFLSRHVVTFDLTENRLWLADSQSTSRRRSK